MVHKEPCGSYGAMWFIWSHVVHMEPCGSYGAISSGSTLFCLLVFEFSGQNIVLNLQM